MKVEKFTELENVEFHMKNIPIKIETGEDIAMISEINQHSLKIGREMNSTCLPNVELHNTGLSIKNKENYIDLKEGDDINANFKVENFIGFENAELDIKNVLTGIKTENEGDIAMVTEINQHTLKIDNTEIKYTYLTNIDLHNAELGIKNEENIIDINIDDNVMAGIEKKEINTTYESCQEPSVEIVKEYGSNKFQRDTKSSMCKTNPKTRTSSSDSSGIKIYECAICKFGTKRKSSLRRHMLIHKELSEITMYKCKECTYESNQKEAVNRHMETHKNPDKCEMCSYETKYKKAMEIHMLNHENPTAVKKFKCDICCYETIQKRNLRRHLLKHKSLSEITPFKCDICTYEAKSKNYLRVHILNHSEIKMYKCEVCTYETKKRNNLNQHILIHKDPSEIPMYRCEFCSFETKYKTCIKRHVLKRHKIPLE